jgi:hypothetical protein
MLYLWKDISNCFVFGVFRWSAIYCAMRKRNFNNFDRNQISNVNCKYLQEPNKCVQIMLIYVRNSLCQRH